MTVDTIAEESDSLNVAFRKGYERLFEKQWPIWIGGLLLGMGNVFLFAFDRPWTVSNGVRNWGDWFFNEIGLIKINVLPPNRNDHRGLGSGIARQAVSSTYGTGKGIVQGAARWSTDGNRGFACFRL